MTNQSKRIIPNPRSVTRFLDQDIINSLGSHNTFEVNDLLEIIKGENLDIHQSSFQFRVELASLINEIPERGESKQYFLDKVERLVRKYGVDSNKEISQAFSAGVVCSLLEPDGQGWRKGKIRLCFEFIPEENTSVVVQEDSVKATQSPLDEIRQLANRSQIEKN
jgi:KGK domain